MLGTIIGVGVFNLPGSLASYGPISLVALALTTVGAVAVALMFASLTRRMPADGGPYAYARAAFGNLVGFSNAWLYWITSWEGNAAIAVGWVLYVERFLNTGHHKAATIGLTLAGIWIAAAINLRGVAAMGRIQLWTSVLKFIPLLLMSTVGLLYTRHRQLRGVEPQRPEHSAGDRGAPWPSACSPTSASSSAPVAAAARCATHSATSRVRPSWAPCSPRPRLPALPDRGVRRGAPGAS